MKNEKQKQLKVLPLGGMGNVSQNMFVYEYGDEILLVDCGLGFPDQKTPGVDILIPDISYLLEQITNDKKRIVGMILSHGHDDHIGSLPYIIPQLPPFPILGSALTIGFANHRLQDGGATAETTVLPDYQKLELSENFNVRLLPMTHSVPDTKHIIIGTKVGNIYHGSDYKIDRTPVDGVKCDIGFMEKISKEEGIKLCLTDCLGVERGQWGKSESAVGPELERVMRETRGKLIVTLMSSHIHRIQQVINAANKLGRKVALVGRSVEQNVKVALDLKKMRVPVGVMINKAYANEYPDESLVLIVAGSQGQEGSAMMRAIYGTHPEIQIKPQDKVIFSADAIPGNEVNYYSAVDELCINGVETIYPTIDELVHHSGHANEPEQVFLLEKIKPRWVMPIGGNNRHRVRYKNLVAPAAGLKREQVLLPLEGEMLSLSEHGEINLVDTIILRPQYVDGLGVGDVGPAVLRDRQALSRSGMIIVIVKRKNGKFDFQDIHVVSRGFVFMRDAQEVVDYIKSRTAELIKELSGKKEGGKVRVVELENGVQRGLAKSLYKIIEREPMIEVEIVDW